MQGVDEFTLASNSKEIKVKIFHQSSSLVEPVLGRRLGCLCQKFQINRSGSPEFRLLSCYQPARLTPVA